MAAAIRLPSIAQRDRLSRLASPIPIRLRSTPSLTSSYVFHTWTDVAVRKKETRSTWPTPRHFLHDRGAPAPPLQQLSNPSENFNRDVPSETPPYLTLIARDKLHRNRIHAMPGVLLSEPFAEENVPQMSAASTALYLRSMAVWVG